MRRIFCVMLALMTVSVGTAVADERKGEFEVHDLSLWIVEPMQPIANARASYPSSLPAAVTTSRSLSAADDPRRPAPFGLMTFHGKPATNLDIDFRSIAGNYLAHWPAGEALPNRLRWNGPPNLDLVEKIEDESDLTFVDSEHWFHKARQGDALFVHRGARAERFLAYDAELGLKVPLQVFGGPDKFTLVYTGDTPLLDVLIARSTPQGCRVAWVDSLSRTDMLPKVEKPSGPTLFGVAVKSAGGAPPTPGAAPAADKKPAALTPERLAAQKALLERARNAGLLPKEAPQRVETSKPNAPAPPAAGAPAAPPAGFDVTLSEPLPVGSTQAAALTTKSLSDRLEGAGLTRHEAGLFAGVYHRTLFDGESLVVLGRLAPGVIEDKMRLSIFPEPAKTVRVALVLMRNVDPQFGNEVDNLVVALGDAKYKTRESAQQRLTELGPLAYAALYKALSGTDLEVVMRAERILLNQNQSLTVQPNPPAAKGKAAPAAARGVFVPAAK